MVFGNLMITLASDGLAKGTKAPKSGKRAEKKKRDATVPPASGQTTPETTGLQEDRGSRYAGEEQPDSTADLFVSPRDEVEPRARKDRSFNANVPQQAPSTNNGPDEMDESSMLEDTVEADYLPMLDPTTTPRQHYREPLTGIKREVWRPGDGDGAPDTDYYDKPGQRPLHQRWRFYQLKTGKGPVSFKNNMPPKYVILDDRAAHEVLTSDIPRATIVRFWSHDFGGPGRIRARRPHRGRSAISNPNATGDEKYFSTEVGMKGEKYYFTGEKNFIPIAYQIPPLEEVTEPQSSKRKASSPPTDEPKDPRKHGHNQYTPKDQLVKYGAPSQAKGRKRYRERINTFLRRSPSPEWAKDRAKLYGGVGARARAFTTSLDKKTAHQAQAAQRYGTQLETTTSSAQSLFLEDDEEMRDVEDDVTSAAEASETMTWEHQPIAPGSNRAPAAASHARDPLVDAAVSESETPTTEQEHEKRHGKKRQPKSFLERMAAEEDEEDDEEQDFPRRRAEPTSLDTGTYASQLEIQLTEANAKVKTLTEDLDQAYDRIEELENEVEKLRD